MIEVYSWATPNGHKVHIMLEECGLPYRVHRRRHRRGRPVQARVPRDQPEQQDPCHRRPRRTRRRADLAVRVGRDPAVPRGQDRHASCPPDRAASYEVLEWLMFQMGGVGPMLGQAHHFRIYAPEKIAYAIDRYTNEAKRLYGVMDKRLADSNYIAGADYSHRRHRDLPVAALVEEPGHRLGRLSAPQRLVRRDRRAACGAARRRGAGRRAQAADRRQGARGAVRRRAVPSAARRSRLPGAMRQSIRSEPAMFECSVQT